MVATRGKSVKSANNLFMHEDIRSRIEAEAPRHSGTGTIHWEDASSTKRSAPATRALLDQELYRAVPTRKGSQYQHRKARQGLYYFAQTGEHRWFESGLEATNLAFLDHSEDIVAIATQPMEIKFDDGTRHFPDFLALHGNHRQVLYDVKPLNRIVQKYVTQFARTKALCDRIGWGYAVLTELDPVVNENLTWLRQFKHHGFYPGSDAVERLLASLTRPLPLREAAAALRLENLAAERSALFHLLWIRAVRMNMSSLISDASLIERTTDADR